MYIGDISQQLSVFLYSLGFGFAVGFLYDISRAFRISFFKKGRLVFFQDVVFFSVAAIITFCFLLVINGGRFRLFVFCALLMGFAVYYLTLSVILLELICTAFRVFKKIILFSASLITAPLRALVGIFSKILPKLQKNSEKSAKTANFKAKNS